MRLIANNKKSYFQYFIIEKIEAGIQLIGDEVKSLRNGKASINEAYAETKKGEFFFRTLEEKITLEIFLIVFITSVIMVGSSILCI